MKTKTQVTLSTLLLSLLMLVLVGCSDSGNSTSALQQNERDKAQKVDKQKQLVNTKWKFGAFVDESNNTKEELEIVELQTDEMGLILEFTNDIFSEKTEFLDIPKDTVLYVIKGLGYWRGLAFYGMYCYLNPDSNAINIGIYQFNKIGEPKQVYKFYDLVNKTHSFDVTKDNLKLYYGEGKDKYLLFNKLTPKIEKK